MMGTTGVRVSARGALTAATIHALLIPIPDPVAAGTHTGPLRQSEGLEDAVASHTQEIGQAAPAVSPSVAWGARAVAANTTASAGSVSGAA